MEEETYIVAFTPGTSGRLIANFVWSMISGIDYDYKLTKYNSTHNFTPFALSYDLSSLPKSNRLFFHKHPDVYRYLKFITNKGVFISHIFPNFDILREKFPNTKLVLITWQEKDYLEIMGNIIFKNMIEEFERGKHDPFFKILVQKIKNISLENLDLNLLTSEDYKNMCLLEAKRVQAENFNSGYMNPVIPEDFTSKTLILEYDQICNNSQLTLKLLEKFVGRSYNTNIVDLYSQYLKGRKNLMKKYMPWLL